MWSDPQGDLQDFVKTNNTLEIDSLIIAEWNMNSFLTIENYGTYRFRPATSNSIYYRLPTSYDKLDQGDFYTDANKSVYTFSDFIDENDEPVIYESEDTKRSLYYDLKQCFEPFRPRSGINKPLYLNTYIDNVRSAKRPRYYMPSRYDNFKYWNSYKKEFVSYTVSNKQMTSGVATLTIGSHVFKNGDSVKIYGVDNNFNGLYAITSIGNNTITYATSSGSTIASASAIGNVVHSSLTTEHGLSALTNPTGFNESIGYIIEDAAPFVVYEKKAPINRIVVKMQTNLADVEQEDEYIDRSGALITDPLTSIDLSSIPKRWKIDYLDENDQWINAISFNENSVRYDGSNIVPWDGHVEISYGLKFPEQFKPSFKLMNYLKQANELPDNASDGHAYIIGEQSGNLGQLYIWSYEIDDWLSIPVEYGFSLVDTDDSKNIGIVNELVDPEYIINGNSNIIYKEVVFIKGLRVSVETMYAQEKTFDLIELSPRLRANVSKYTSNISITKNIANDSTGLPVGGLLASNGTLSLFNYDGAFTENNDLKSINDLDIDSVNTSVIPIEGSLISKYLKPNVKFDIYESIKNVNGYDKFIPVKSLYSEIFPSGTAGESVISITLRDLFFRLETTRATPLFLTNITLTAAVAILLDSIGFSNYVFLGFDERESIKVENMEFYASIQDPVIPYFFVQPDVSVSQILIDLATSFQAAMFFDEYNNFVMMPKEYMLPKNGYRATDVTLYGHTASENGLIVLPNIINIEGAETKILNDGTIQYTTRYIQREVSSLQQARYIDQDKTFNYLPVLLWEVGTNQETKTINQSQTTTQGASLAAIPLDQELTNAVPIVNEDRQIVNNIMKFGENILWLGKFQGYLYANGEIIRFDAVEYNVPVSGSANVWITSNQEYQKYFGAMKFGGKIFPTGNVRIYSEPYYEVVNGNTVLKKGEVKKHGRGQFGTPVISHSSGLPSYWSDDANVQCCKMESNYLFTTTPTEKISYPAEGNNTVAVGASPVLATGSTRNGIIKNFLRAVLPSDEEVRKLKTTQSATIQSSAFVFAGVQSVSASATSASSIVYPQNSNKRDFIFYVHKKLDAQYKHFGTRLRIIGKKKIGESFQVPRGSFEYFSVTPDNSSEKVSIEGGSAGIGIGVNPLTNIGYYFEITSMTTENLEQYQKTNEDTNKEVSVLHNINFYKIVNSGNKAIPKKLWGRLGQILVDEGLFIGMDRVGITTPTVYDLSVEYENVGSLRRFYLYINGTLLDIIDDANPLPEYNNMCLFVRGSSEVMFENAYAIQNIIAKDLSQPVISDISDVFAIEEISSINALRKYGISGFVQASYLTGISAGTENRYKMFYEEFGTTMRECQYYNIRYDKAYPALIAMMAPAANGERGYTVSGFQAGSYGAEFLIFNNTDKTINFDESTGNFLRILGVTFTQNTSSDLTVDEYFKERSNFSDPFIINTQIIAPTVAEKKFDDIKTSRKRNGKKEFSLSPLFIQNGDMAGEMMDWLVDKTLRERKSYNVNVFGLPHLQLGDIVSIDFDMPEGVKLVDSDKQFVVSSISYSKTNNQLSTLIKVVEV